MDDVKHLSSSQDRLCVGIWFQRTNIHLREFFRFAQGQGKIPGLDAKKLATLRNNLHAQNLHFLERDLNLLTLQSEGIDMSMTEDGVILLSKKEANLSAGVKALEKYYRDVFGPALSYLFSRGAPVPKSLSNLKEIFPIVVVTKNKDEKGIRAIYETFKETPYTSAHASDVTIYFSNNLNVFNLHEPIMSDAEVDELLRLSVFFRDLESQLNEYLELHRDIWDEVSGIRETPSLRSRDFPIVRNKILDITKTLSFVEARIAQMGNILDEREAVVSEHEHARLRQLELNSFESLKAGQRYVSNLWNMTEEYTEKTLDLLKTLYEDNAQRGTSILNFLLFLTVLTGFFGMNIAFPWQPEWMKEQLASWMTIFAICVISLTGYILLARFVDNQKFDIRTEKKKKEH